MDNELAGKLKYLRLGGVLAHWDEYLKLAAKKRFSHTRLLTHILEEEYRIKRENARKLRIKRAHIPDPFVIETYPFDRQPKLNKKMIMNLYESFEYMKKSRGIIWLGPTGVGKSGLAKSFLVHAIDQGYTGRFIAFAELVQELYRSVGDHTEDTLLKRSLIRLSARRRDRVCRGGTGSGRVILYPNAQAAQEKVHAVNIKFRVPRLGVLS